MDKTADNFINFDESLFNISDHILTQDYFLPSTETNSSEFITNTQSPNISQQDPIYFEPMSSQDHLLSDQIYFNLEKPGFEHNLSEKSKRIQKRNTAKDRVKAKRQTEICLGESSSEAISADNDLNTDENTNKKMSQKLRNRISAQNSRDRKKNYVAHLEEENKLLKENIFVLQDENRNLTNELAEFQKAYSQVMEENQSLKNANLCSTCRGFPGANYDSQNSNQETNNNSDNEVSIVDFGGLSSPSLSRFNSMSKGFLSFVAFATILSFVAIANIQSNEIGVMQDINSGLKDVRVLNNIDVDDYNLNGNGNIYLHHLDLSSSLILANMNRIKNQFELNYEPIFKSQYQKLTLPLNFEKDLFVNPIDYKAQNYNNAIIEYDSPVAHHLRRRSPTIISRIAPIIDPSSGNMTHTSTIFIPSGIEFFGKPNLLNINDAIQENGLLDLEKAEYIQLLIPKKMITRYNVEETALTDIYGLPIESEDNADDSLLEIWVKVFHMRELGVTY